MLLTVGSLSLQLAHTQDTKRPNVIFIMTDDLGYGDMSAYGSNTIQTPNFDRLANNGIKFTNGYAAAASSTPSRYSFLTGMYPWRKNINILPGDAPMIINTNEQTVPTMMKNAGYTTAIIGKWHLGLGKGNINWNKKISLGPNEVGFDYSYILAATNDRVPCVYIKNGNVVNLDINDPIQVNYNRNFAGEPTGKDNPELLRMHPSYTHDNSIVNGVSRLGYMTGGKSALWVDEDMADTLLNQTINYVRQHKSEPFFLYYALHQPHVPRIPNSRFAGKSGMGPRGDAILEADWCVGVLLDELATLGLLENTLIFFSSDNGPVLDDGYKDMAVELLGNHQPTGVLRGGKGSLLEGGTRVPFLVHWPAMIKPQVSNAIVSQTDILASLCGFFNQPLERGKDSEDVMNAFLGKSKSGRKELVLQAGRYVSFRSGKWLLIPPYQGKPMIAQTNTETGILPEYQLYNLNSDMPQKKNVANKNQKLVRRLEARLNEIKINK